MNLLVIEKERLDQMCRPSNVMEVLDFMIIIDGDEFYYDKNQFVGSSNKYKLCLLCSHISAIEEYTIATDRLHNIYKRGVL